MKRPTDGGVGAKAYGSMENPACFQIVTYQAECKVNQFVREDGVKIWNK